MEFQVFWRKFCPLWWGIPKTLSKTPVIFAEFVRSKTLKADQVLVSFDVVSLFTNIPVDLAIKVATKRLRQDATLLQRTSLPVEDIIIDRSSVFLSQHHIVCV
jgi:hypothetical protein